MRKLSKQATRWQRAAVTLAASLLAWAAPAVCLAAAKPNVVLIVIDDYGWTDATCYGSRFYRTPNIDRLAAEGMRFTQAYAACPVCSPTRAALMTGKYPARVHLTDWLPGRKYLPSQKLLAPDFRHELPLEEMTVAELLRAAGYATASIGKWHLGGAGFEPTRQGLELNVAGDASGSPPGYFAPYLRSGHALPGLQDALPGEYLTDRLTSEAEKFLEAHHHGPFFLYLPHFAVHTPLEGKPDRVEAYRSAAKPPGLQQNPIYAAMVESMDESVGRIVRKLDSLGIGDDTIVILTSDNGGLATAEGPNTPATNNAPLREGKGYLYEGGIRVPLVIKWPRRVNPGGTSAAPASSVDILPTIAEACDVAPPAAVDGVSLVPLVTGGGALPPRALFWHYPHYSPQGGKPGGAIRDGNFKLIEFYEQGRRELYDLATDPSENTNLAAREPSRVEALAARLAAWRKEVDAQMPSVNPDYTPDVQAQDGTITLPGATADIHGAMVRYEPLPHKRTIGFWVDGDDWISWQFDVKRRGTFELEVMQGCGPGSGGSTVEFRVGQQAVSMTVDETGGFQNFVKRTLGAVTIAEAGRHTLEVRPQTKPGPAVMDLRQVRLIPRAGSE